MKYVLAIDDTDHSRRAVTYLRGIVRPKMDEVIIYTAGKDEANNEKCIESAMTVFRAVLSEELLSFVNEAGRDPREGIVECTQQSDADILVMGTRGFGEFKKAIVGSVSSDIMHSCGRAVTIVREPPPIESVHNYMLCVDASEQAARASDFLGRMIHGRNDVHVTIFAAYVKPTLTMAHRNGERSYADEVAAIVEKVQKSIATGRAALINGYAEFDRLSKQDKAAKDSKEEVAQDEIDQSIAAAEALLESKIESHVEESIDDSKASTRVQTIAFANNHSIHTIICGSRGLGVVKGAILGSFSAYLVQNAPKHAILIVH